MARPYLYHVWDDPKFDSVGPFASVEIKVPGLITAASSETKKFYSLKRDFEELRKEGAAKGIVDPSVVALEGKSSEGRELWALKLGKGGRHKVLFTGAHHSREWISVAIPYYVAEYLIRNYKDAPANEKERRIKSLVDNRTIWFVPLCNPDGHDFTLKTNRNWRPNRRVIPMTAFTITRHWTPAGDMSPTPVPGGTTETIDVPDGNYTGTDINRNYPVSVWGHETGKRTPSGRSDMRTSLDPRPRAPSVTEENSVWCGPSAGSEPETKAIAALIDKEGFRASVSYHSFSQLLLWPDTAIGDKFVEAVGNGMGELINETASPKYKIGPAGKVIYEVTGSAMDYSYEKSPGRPSYTPELRPAEDGPREHHFSGLPEDQIEDTLKENLGAALAIIGCAGANSASKAGHTITVTGNLVNVAVNLNCWQVFKGWTP